MLQSLSVRGKKVAIEYSCGRNLYFFCFFFQGQSRRAFLSPNEFISNKLAAKITRQLQGNVLFAVRMKSLKYMPVFEVLTCTLFTIPIRSHYSNNWQLPFLGRRASSKMVSFYNPQTS